MVGKPAKRSLGFSPKKKETFLALLAEGYTVTHAAQRVGLSRRAAYYLRDRDHDFAEAWQAAYDASTELLEQECFQRAVGREEAVLGKDGQVHYVKKYSDLLLMFLLKARKPRMYRDQLDISISEKREIVVNLLPVVRDEVTGKLMVAEEEQPPLLTPGE